GAGWKGRRGAVALIRVPRVLWLQQAPDECFHIGAGWCKRWTDTTPRGHPVPGAEHRVRAGYPWVWARGAMALRVPSG
ncbi:MAG: hypothetical protein ACRERD_00435, partial [Candidatus Binatia bacterium]